MEQPPRTRSQRLALPVTLGATAATGAVALALIDPSDGGVPLCWSRSVFGIDCPFCGGLRATSALVRGDLGEALDHNVVLAVALPLAALALVVWSVRAWQGRPTPRVRLPLWVGVVAIVALGAFTVVRNLDEPTWATWLHSDLAAAAGPPG